MEIQTLFQSIGMSVSTNLATVRELTSIYTE